MKHNMMLLDPENHPRLRRRRLLQSKRSEEIQHENLNLDSGDSESEDEIEPPINLFDDENDVEVEV